MKPRWAFSILVAAIVGLPAFAVQVTESFTSRQQFSSGSAVWNQALGQVHPSIKVTGYTGAATPDTRVDVGDGSDGAFIQSRYSEFSVNGNTSGNIIRLDLTSPRTLNVTEFILEAGWFLEPVGNNYLIIRSQSDVKVRGEIWCHGQNGSVNVGAVGGTGGQGRCGGGAGGDGGSQPGLVGGTGVGPTTLPVTGGMGGFGNAGGAGGDAGGGGGWSLVTAPDAGTGFTGGIMPGKPGTSVSDPEFDFYAGGGGGGGGGAGSTSAGAGGGGGGGVVVIHTARDFELGHPITPNIGFIYAGGGDGADGSGNGGDGAGGGGGSVQVFAGGTIRMYNANGGLASSYALRGRNVGASGGAGGRNWYTSVAYTGSGFYDPGEEGPVIPGNYAVYEQTQQSVESRSYDLLNTLSEVQSITTSPTSADFGLQWKGSSDDFASDDTGWTTSVAVLSQKRFIKFRFLVTSSSATAPTYLDSVTIDYVPGTRGKFDFKAEAGCGSVGGGGSGGGGSPVNGLWLLLPLFLLFSLRVRFARK
jgi:hypothetical protein